MRFFPSKDIFRILAVLLALTLTAAACGSDDAEESTTEEAAPAADDFSDLSVVMILDGSAQDGGWNTTHVRGGDKIEAAFPGINIEYVEEVAPGQTATNAFQDAVDGGADVVIGTTYYQDDMMDVAAASPDVTFLTWAGFTTADNVEKIQNLLTHAISCADDSDGEAVESTLDALDAIKIDGWDLTSDARALL